MDLRTCIELVPTDSRKSFYGKAYTYKEGAMWKLVSYNTIVAEYNTLTREFTRLWSGYSATTMRHVNSFVRFCGFDHGGKKWWDTLETYKPVVLTEIW